MTNEVTRRQSRGCSGYSGDRHSRTSYDDMTRVGDAVKDALACCRAAQSAAARPTITRGGVVVALLINGWALVQRVHVFITQDWHELLQLTDELVVFNTTISGYITLMVCSHVTRLTAFTSSAVFDLFIHRDKSLYTILLDNSVLGTILDYFRLPTTNLLPT